MRLPTLFLTCLLLVAACNLALAARRQFQLRRLPPALAETHPTDAFAARLETISDPAELRRLALARHRALLDADHTTQDLLGTVGTLSRSELTQSGIVFLLGLGVYFFRPTTAPLKNTGEARGRIRGLKTIMLATIPSKVLLSRHCHTNKIVSFAVVDQGLPR